MKHKTVFWLGMWALESGHFKRILTLHLLALPIDDGTISNTFYLPCNMGWHDIFITGFYGN